jgi:hypothetical protein
MSVAELYEIHVQLVSIVNEVWQLWLGGTFGFIVAFHIGKDSIDKAVFWVGSSIYLIASIILIVRYLDYAIAIGGLIQKVSDAGGDPLQPAGWSTFYGPMTLVLMVFGSVSAVWYAYRATNRSGT